MSAKKSILIVGAGITGLAAAVRAQQWVPQAEITLCETQARAGGLLQTQSEASAVIELSADMFTTKIPEALQLCEAIGFTSQLIPTFEKKRGAAIATPGAMQKVPDGFSLMAPNQMISLLRSPLLGPTAKLRVLLEPLLCRSHPKRWADGQDESLQSFAIRHFGRQVFDRLIQPLVSGIYTADPNRLSMKAAMYEFVEMENQHGSLVKAAWQKSRQQRGSKTSAHADTNASEAVATGARYGLFVTPRHGMQSWVQAIVQWLTDRQVNFQWRTSVVAIQSTHGAEDQKPRWQVDFVSEQQQRSEIYDAVVVCLPAPTAAQVIQKASRELSRQLSSIEYASAAIVVSRFHVDQLPDRGQGLGFGLVVPHYLGSPLIASSFSTNKFAGRGADDNWVVRSFVGGALNPEIMQHSDAELINIASHQLQRWLKFSGQTNANQVVRWEQAMPQYHVGHVEKVNAIEKMTADLSGFAIAGNAYRGVGIPQCIHSGGNAIKKILHDLHRM